MDSYTPNTKGMISPEQVEAASQRLADPKELLGGGDEQLRAVASATKELPWWQKLLKPKNWPTAVKVAVSAAIGAALVASGVSHEIVAPILAAIFGG